MALEYEIDILADSGWDMHGTRMFKMYFSEPEQKFKEDPGILLLIAGYGGEAKSNVYCKMRNEFADKYNLFVVQCNYLGWEFMQTTLKNEEILELKGQGEFFVAKAGLNEDDTNYNEMGPFQMLDNVLAIKSLIDIIQANGRKFNTSRVGVYGHSQGAYLAHLCNCFFPFLFTDIIDNSAWSYPAYLEKKREHVWKIDQIRLKVEYEYKILGEIEDKEIYDLRYLYKQFINNSSIICFQGIDDVLVDFKEKKKMSDFINNFQMKLITEEDVDNNVFHSTKHGLDADFLKMFDYAIERFDVLNGKKGEGGSFTGSEFLTSKYLYKSFLVSDIPRLKRIERL